MTASLHELRNEQDSVRLRLFKVYKTGNKSILGTSKDIMIPYSSLRGFMLGKRLSDLNLLKIKAWMKD